MENLYNGFRIIKSMEDREYLFNSIVYSIAPAICGYKCATLVSFRRSNRNILKLWRIYKSDFLRVIPLDYYELLNNREACTVIFYNAEKLKNIIYQKQSMNLLSNLGYKEHFSLEEYLHKLKDKFQYCCPHEIGLFLGIPIEDVKAFINNKGKDYIYCGYWKVYSNLDDALKTFDSYNKIKNLVMEKVIEGRNSYEILSLLKNYN